MFVNDIILCKITLMIASILIGILCLFSVFDMAPLLDILLKSIHGDNIKWLERETWLFYEKNVNSHKLGIIEKRIMMWCKLLKNYISSKEIMDKLDD